jgi:type I restriction-modification system DNA methylase subunit
MSLSYFIWSVADLLRGDFKQSEYGKVILPFMVLRRMDCVLAVTKKAVLAELDARNKSGINPESFLKRKAKQSFAYLSKVLMRFSMHSSRLLLGTIWSGLEGSMFSLPQTRVMRPTNIRKLKSGSSTS